MKRLLQRWHWIHTWTSWERFSDPVGVYYPWTAPGRIAYLQLWFTRRCKVCGYPQTRTENL